MCSWRFLDRNCWNYLLLFYISEFSSLDRTIRASVHRTTSLRFGGILRGLALLHPVDIRSDTWRGSHGDLAEIRRRPGLRCQQTVLLVSRPRSRGHRRGSHRRGREERHLGGVAKLSRRQDLHGHSGKSNFSHINHTN